MPTSADQNLSAYYVSFLGAAPPPGYTSFRPFAENQPFITYMDGKRRYPNFPNGVSGYIARTTRIFSSIPNTQYYLVNYPGSSCGGGDAVPSAPITTGARTYTMSWRRLINDGEGCGLFPEMPPGSYLEIATQDTITSGAPMRRVALDGGQYDASPMIIKRNGLPWYSHYFGYHLGLVANESNWDDANASAGAALGAYFGFPNSANNFNLVSLPPPWVEADVVEYVNRADFPAQPDGQFFYASIAAEKTALDAVPSWSRTGRSFKSGGYVTVCRFYGGRNGGPNTHFYSGDARECNALKRVTTLDYEGQSFAVNMPMPPKTEAQHQPGALRDCPLDSKPLYRLYNNAAQSSGRFVSNHRYTTDRADVTAFAAKGWVDEGHQMCVPE